MDFFVELGVLVVAVDFGVGAGMAGREETAIGAKLGTMGGVAVVMSIGTG